MTDYVSAWLIITLGGGWLGAGVVHGLADAVDLVRTWRHRRA